ncbi:MAG: NADH:flavin oxidoreductase [Polyangiaceae bacterium]|nr:NADH:flavin oxidoreductase [Myxococcales bacterium]MCB9587172.1 NADH:flavin oxidoreductase [Polyangiaceae bacterium]
MWKPPNARKVQLPLVSWPDSESARQSRWFSPITLGPVQLEQRTWVPAMVPWRATEGGEVTPAVIDWYRRFAAGRPGAIVVEATGIRDVPSGPLLRIGHERYIDGLSKIAEAVRGASNGRTRLFIQLIDFLAIRRRVEPSKYLSRFLQLDAALLERLGLAPGDDALARERLLAMNDEELAAVLPARALEELRQGYRERVTDVHLEHIRELPRQLPELFASAAERAKLAGFDGVELHYAHAYTMSSFLSALNTRGDGYGGPREQRARLPLEVYGAVRAAVGSDFCVGARFLTDDIVAGGSRVDDACYFGTRFAAAGMDFLSLSRGGRFEDAKQPKVGHAAYPYTGQSGYECMPSVYSDQRGPFGRNIADTARVRQAVRSAGHQTPVVVCGGIHSFEQAEEILRTEQADIVAAARQSLADPDWFLKVSLGRGNEVRRCEFTNYCEALDQMHKPVTCKLWDHQDLNADESRTPDGRRRLVAPPWS